MESKMRWEELTSDEFAKALDDSNRTCVLPLGSMERHGPHMALGTDTFIAHYVATNAALSEPVVVYPQLFFGEMFEVKCFPGSITLPPKLLLELLLAVLDDIGRNGFTKIIIYNCHGGNVSLVQYACQSQMAEKKPYQVYSLFYNANISEADKANMEEMWDTPGGGGHAGEGEASLLMAYRQDMVKLDVLNGRVGEHLGRLDHLKPGYAPLMWYGNYPDNYRGDAADASIEKGKVFAKAMIDGLTRFIRVVKDDTATGEVIEEYFQRERELQEGSKESET
jgi:creatinine amidohydrolase